MKTVLMAILAVALAVSSTARACPRKSVFCGSRRGRGTPKATIAVSINLAKHLLEESDDSPIDRDLITRQMIEDVLSGREESVETTDPRPDSRRACGSACWK